MKRKNALPELLAPAGTYEAMLAAVAGGADAVYLGGKAFGARAFAGNFDTEELARTVRYCHLHGVRVYVTVNILVSDREEEDLLSYVGELGRMGVDALIVADVGAVRRIHEAYPGMELHASTQMSVHNVEGARFAAALGCCRVVPARELSKAEIAAIVDEGPCETEVFLHGALCVSHSGQCLFSSLVGGRSGNRGECAQPCRLPYHGGYPLSLTDLSLAGHIEELISSGVASLKIEGRMKSSDYVFTVTSVYRRLLDEGRSADEKERATLAAAFSRGGFTDGYYTGHKEQKMTGVRSAEDKEKTRDTEKHIFTEKRLAVSAEIVIRAGVPSRLSLSLGTVTVSAEGAVPRIAETSPLTSAGVISRMAKLGGTFFSLDEADAHADVAPGLNLSPGELNALRRAAVELLEAHFARPLRTLAPEAEDGTPCEKNDNISGRSLTDDGVLPDFGAPAPSTDGHAAPCEENGKNPACCGESATASREKSATVSCGAEGAGKNIACPAFCGFLKGNKLSSDPVAGEADVLRGGRRTALFFDPRVLTALSDGERAFFDIRFVPAWRFAEAGGAANGVAVPPVVFPSEVGAVREMLFAAKAGGARFALVGNPGAVPFAEEAGLTPVGDFRLNVTNTDAAKVFSGQGIAAQILSAELTAPAVRDLCRRSPQIAFGAIVYGRVPLMLTERCFMKENFGCGKCGTCALDDRRGAAFPMMREYPHRNLIFNAAYTYLCDRPGDTAPLAFSHYLFTTERPAEVGEVIAAAKRHAPLPLAGAVRRMGRRDPEPAEKTKKK